MSVVTMLKSSSDGEILDQRQETSPLPSSVMINTTGGVQQQQHHHTTSSGKLRRAFTMPRNPFATNRRKIKNNRDLSTNDDNSNLNHFHFHLNNNNKINTTNEDDYNHINNNNNNKKPFRRPSIKKFLTKMVHHLSTVTVHHHHHHPLHHHHHHHHHHSNKPFEISSLCIRDPDCVPGVTGLRNHGNTCFINAVLQCLSHTDILAEYFVLDQYKIDLSKRNKLNAKKYGTRGEVTEQLALLLKSIWSCQYTPELSNQFKVLVDKYGSQYRGNNQHDAQEFLVWLLDKVHEDLNTATKRRYKTIKNSFGRPDAVVASETLANHARCNNSFVQAVFQAQFRSSLTCPRCNAQSNTFDPFLCVSVPLPQEQRRPLYVNVLYTSQQPRQVKLGLSVPVTSDIRELREILASDTGIDVSRMLLTELDDEGFHRTFSDTQPVAAIKEWEPIYCLELPNECNDDQEEREATILLCWTNLVMELDSSIRFGSPYTMQVGRETSYHDLQKLILKEMAPILHDDVLTSQQEVPAFALRICDGLGGNYLDPCVDHPLYMEAVEQAIALCQEDSGPPHLKLVLEWTQPIKEKLIADDSDQMEELASVKQIKNNSEHGGAVSLEECFELYTRAEILGAEDAWHCPNCNRKQEVVKKLGLWSLPDILVIHLKRFRQSKQRSTTKLTTLVNFPLYGFDMSPHLAQPTPSQQDGYNNSHPPPSAFDSESVKSVLGGLGRSPWKRPRRHLPRLDDNVYDLYAICNHHGSDLQGGHYTAFCRNPYDTQWYQFDDAKVTPINEQGLATPSAYILFYQRRGLVGSSTAPGSSAASTSSSGSGGGCGTDHWVYRMPPFHNPTINLTPNGPKQPTDNGEISMIPTKEDLITTTVDETFPRNNRSYSTLQPQSLPSRRTIATETDDNRPMDINTTSTDDTQQIEMISSDKQNKLVTTTQQSIGHITQEKSSTPTHEPIITESCV